MVARLGFLVVGTPRSGTTVVQRLAGEVPGVGIPPETHFFSLFAEGLLNRRSFPLEATALHDELERYRALPECGELVSDADAVVELLEGRAADPVELFEAIVVHAAGAAERYGEKTPTHLLWWRYVLAHRPDTRIVAVVRDPRAVVASNLDVPWGMESAELLAARWSDDQATVRAIAASLPEDRFLLLRYEDVARDPESARAKLAALVGVTLDQPPEATADPDRKIYLEWESWKAGSTGPIVTDQIDAWRERLDRTTVARVAAICAAEMRRFGYDDGVPGKLTAGARRAVLPVSVQVRLRKFRRVRRAVHRRIATMAVGAVPPASHLVTNPVRAAD